MRSSLALRLRCCHWAAAGPLRRQTCTSKRQHNRTPSALPTARACLPSICNALSGCRTKQNRICGLRSKQDVTKHSARLRGRCFKRVLRWRQRRRHQCQCRQTRRSILAAALPVTAPATCLSLSLCNKWPTRLPAQQIIPMRSPKTQNRGAVGCAPLGNSWEDCGRKRRGWEAGWRLKSLENFADLLSAEQRVWRADAGTKKG